MPEPLSHDKFTTVKQIAELVGIRESLQQSLFKQVGISSEEDDVPLSFFQYYPRGRFEKDLELWEVKRQDYEKEPWASVEELPATEAQKAMARAWYEKGYKLSGTDSAEAEAKNGEKRNHLASRLGYLVGIQTELHGAATLITRLYLLYLGVYMTFSVGSVAMLAGVMAAEQVGFSDKAQLYLAAVAIFLKFMEVTLQIETGKSELAKARAGVNELERKCHMLVNLLGRGKLVLSSIQSGERGKFGQPPKQLEDDALETELTLFVSEYKHLIGSFKNYWPAASRSEEELRKLEDLRRNASAVV